MAMRSLVSRIITKSRSPSLPSAATFLNTSIVSKLEPASWKLVTPFDTASSSASWTSRRVSASTSSGFIPSRALA